MFGFFENNNKKIAKKQIKNNIRTAKQIIKELPRDVLREEGGMEALIKRTQVNIAGSLLGYGLVCQSVAVYGLDIDDFRSLEDLDKAVNKVITSC